MKRIISLLIVLVICFGMISLAIPSVKAMGSVSESMAYEKIYELYNILGDSSYFTTTRTASCGAKSSNHSCNYCHLQAILKSSWFVEKFGTLSTNQFPITYYSGGVPHGPNGWSCFGFASFAEWYIYSGSQSDKVTTEYIGTFNYNYDEVSRNIRVGDIIRVNDVHSAIVISYDQNGVKVLESNGTGAYNCQVHIRTIKFLNQTFSISRAVNSVEGDSNGTYVESYPSSGTVKITKATTLKSLPCSKDTNAESTDIHTPSVGSEWDVAGIYQNTVGNYWYKTSYNGQDCYLYSGDAEFISADWGEITISGVAAPTSLELGEGFPIKGYISSSKLPLSFVEAYVLSGGSVATKSEASPAEDAKTFEIYRSAVDMNLKFGSLASGTYTYQIVVTPLNYKADGNSLTSLTPRTFILHESKFTVGSVASCSHSYSSEITVQGNCVEPSIRTYTCTLCGDSYTETIPAIGMHSYSAWETIDSATCTEQGTQQRICVTC